MKNRKKIFSTLVGVAIASQILPTTYTIVNAQTSNNTNTLIENQTQGSQTENTNNTITFAGIGCQEGTHQFDLLIDHQTNTLKVKNIVGLYGGNDNHQFHPYFKGEYVKITLLDSDGNIKNELSINGTDNLKVTSALNSWTFKTGDRLRFSHAESDWRVKITGNVTNQEGQKVDLSTRTSKDDLNNYDFEITESGLQEVPTFTNKLNETKITLAGAGCQESEGIHRFELLLDPLTKKLKVNIISGLVDGKNHPFHPSFKNEYINITLLDSDGNVKETLSMKGTDNVALTNALNDWTFEYGDRLRINHAEAGWRTKIDGNVNDLEGQEINLSNGTSKDVLNKCDFEITKSGLQEVETFTNELNKTKITLSGIGCQESPGEGGYHKFELSLDPETKKLKVNNLVGLYRNHPFHPYFKNEYINITLLDSDGNVKETLSIKGTDNVALTNALNSWTFEYGDRLRINHQEANWRTKIDGNVTNTQGQKVDLSNGTSKNVLNTCDFEITKSGLQEVETFTNELNKTKITLSGIGCQEGTHQFAISLDPKTKKLKVGNVVGLYNNHAFHPYFKGEYINIQLIGEDGTVKKEFSMNGTNNVTKAQNDMSGWNFEYGDCLRINHQEADWRTKIDGNVTNTQGQRVDLSNGTSKTDLNRYDFKITKSGLQEVLRSN